MKEIFIAAIPSLFTLIGVIVTVAVGNKATKRNIQEQTDLTLYRLAQVEKKQDKYNHLIERMYKAEQNIELLNEKAKVANRRIDDLEKGA